MLVLGIASLQGPRPLSQRDPSCQLSSDPSNPLNASIIVLARPNLGAVIEANTYQLSF